MARALRLAGMATGGAHLAYFDLATATLRYARPDGASWAIEAVDTASDVGRHSALALDAAGRGHAGYYDATRGAVKYAVQDQGGWRVEMVDADASAYYERTGISLALDSQGQPHLAYADAASASVKYAQRTGNGWQIEIVDPEADVGTRVSLALDASGMPHIAYRRDGPEKSIAYATRGAAGWQIEVVTTQGVGSNSEPALALSQAGDTRIAFVAQVANSPGIMVAARNPATGDWEIEPVAAVSSYEQSVTLAFAIDGVAHLAWSDWNQSSNHGVVQYAVQAAGWRIETVDAGGRLYDIALALDAGGHPFIVLIDLDPQSGVIQLRVAYRDAAGWHIEIPDLADQDPASPALALDQAGRPLFSYYDAVTGDLRLAGRAAAPPITSTPPDPLPWQATCIDCPRAFDSLADHSLQVDSQGRLHVAYGGDHLYYATFDGLAWQRAVVDAAPGVGRYASLALDPNGAPSIAYYDAVRGDLKIAWIDAGEWRTAVVESTGDVGRFASLALDQAGSPHISYFDASQQRLRYATRDAAGWRLETVATQGLSDVSLALTGAGQPRIAYAAGDGLSYAYRDSAGWHVEAVGDPQVYGWRVSLALDGAGWPHIAYSGGGDLGYAWRDAAAWRAESVVQGETSSPALALDPAGAPHISYRFHRERGAKHELRYVRRDDAGSGWRTETIDASYELGDDASALALDVAGIAQIIYLVDSVLTLASHGPQGGWSYQAVDESSWASGSDLALDGRGELHASYLTGGARAGRWYATRDGAGWQREAVAASREAAVQAGAQSGGAAGRRIAVDANGAPHLAYTTFYRDPVDPQGDHYNLWYAHTNPSTAQWSIERPDPWSGSDPALALDAGGLPHISYRKIYQYPSSSALLYAVRCGSGWCREQVDGGGDDYFAGIGSSLALDSAGQAQISYLAYASYDATDRQLKLAVKDATGWSVEVVDQDVDVYQATTALALAADQPWVAYTKHFDLMLAFRDGADWRYEVVEDAGSVSGSIELVIDSQGQPRIGYFNGGRLRYAVRTSQGWQLHDVAPAGLAACCSAGFVLGPDDTPFFAFTDADSKDFLLVTTAARTERIFLPLMLKGHVQ